MFHKFVLAPTTGDGALTAEDYWDYMAEVSLEDDSFSELFAELEDTMSSGGSRFNHIHIGISLDTFEDARYAERQRRRRRRRQGR